MAVGRFSKIICQRCGEKKDYLAVKKESGTNYWVCDSCNDGEFSLTSHPQNRPPNKKGDDMGLDHSFNDVNVATSSTWTPPTR